MVGHSKRAIDDGGAFTGAGARWWIGEEVVRGEGGRERRGAAGQHRLCVRQRRGELQAHTRRRRVFLPQHAVVPRLLRHERLLPSRRAPRLRLRLWPHRRPHLH